MSPCPGLTATFQYIAVMQKTLLLAHYILFLLVVNFVASDRKPVPPIPLQFGQGQIIQPPLPPSIKTQQLQKLGDSNFTCKNVLFMLHKKSNLLSTVSRRIADIQKRATISPDLKLQIEVLAIFQRELRATEKSLIAVLQDLNETLSSGYQSLEKIKKSCQLRLDDMRDAAVLVEEDYSSILELEKEMKSLHPNISLQTHYHVLDELFSEIIHAADDLESNLQEDIFGDSKKLRGASVETVIKLHEDELYEHGILHMQKKMQEGKRSLEEGEAELGGERGHFHQNEQEKSQRGRGISVLVDSASNQYILSHPRDITVAIEDHRFIHDIINLLLLSFLLGIVCSIFKVPSLFGYIFAGMVLGPSGYNTIISVVQVETIGEFGVFFIVFAVGLEFSPEKLHKVWRVAIYGGNLLLIISMVIAVLLGLPLGVHPQNSLMVASCLALSSNVLATKLVDSNEKTPRIKTDHDHKPPAPEEPESDLSNMLDGILVMQDIQLGMLVALIPFFTDSPSNSSSGSLFWFLQIIQVTVAFPLLIIVARGVTTKLLEKFYRLLNTSFNKSENLLLGSIAVCLSLLLFAEMLKASLELGCFLAGVAISSQGPAVVDPVRRVVEPVRDFLAVFFFASLGFHVFPTFLKSEFTTICSVTISVVILKLFIGVCVLGFFTGHCKSSTWSVAFSLAQVSEFSFVLASRARQLRIISREVYLVILSIAAMSLLLAPVLWRTFHLQSPLRRGSLSFLYRCLSKLPRSITFTFRSSRCSRQKSPLL